VYWLLAGGVYLAVLSGAGTLLSRKEIVEGLQKPLLSTHTVSVVSLRRKSRRSMSFVASVNACR